MKHRSGRRRFGPGICGETPFLDLWNKYIPVEEKESPRGIVTHRAGDHECRCLVGADHKDWLT